MESQSDQPSPIDPSKIRECIAILEALNTHTDQIFEIPKEDRVALIKAAGEFSRPDKEELLGRKRGAKKAIKKKLNDKDKQARKATGIRSAREATIFIAPSMVNSENTEKEVILESPRECYVCKTSFARLHHFYDSMCKDCGDFNYAKRFKTADLTNQVALVTGSRLKIGYHITIIMLRAGATVIATTRFPVDSAIR